VGHIDKVFKHSQCFIGARVNLHFADMAHFIIDTSQYYGFPKF
jgi:hypothetical protein